MGIPGWRQMSKTPLAALQTRIGPAWPKRGVAGWVGNGRVAGIIFMIAIIDQQPLFPKKRAPVGLLVGGAITILKIISVFIYIYIYVYIYMYNIVLAGGWPAPLKNDGLRQSGWWYIPNTWKVMKFMYQTTKQWCFNSLLVGGATTILKNMSLSMGRIIPYIVENKKCWKPPTSLCCWWTPSFLHTFYKVVR